MAIGKITNGIAEIAIDGDVLGYTEEDSFSIITDDNTSTISFPVEERDNPIYTRRTGSKEMSVEFTIADPDQDALATLFDGTVSGADVEVDGVSHIMQGVPFYAKAAMGWSLQADKADITARLSDTMGKNSLLGVVVTVTFNEGFTFKDEDSGSGGGGGG